MVTRTTHRSKAGKKLYAVRGKDGKFKDIQQYSRAHAMDIKRHSKAEEAVDKKLAAKKVVKKTTAKKTVSKKKK